MRYRELGWTSAVGSQLFVRSWEPESDSAGVVAIVHGLGEHSGRYGEVAGQFVRAGYSVLAFDQQGHGQSEGPRGHIRDYETLLDDVHLLVEEALRRSATRPVFLYGHSMGGNLVLNYALRRPTRRVRVARTGSVRGAVNHESKRREARYDYPSRALAGLVVTSPLLRLVTPPPVWKSALGRCLNRVWPRCSFHNKVDPQDLSHDAQIVRAYGQDPLVHHRVSARLATQLLDAGVWAIGHADRLDLPLLLMHGSADRLTSPEASREFAHGAGANCRLKIWDGLLHELHWECERDEVLQFALAWLHEVSQQYPDSAATQIDGLNGSLPKLPES